MHVKEIDSWKSKESKGSISLKSFLLSFFDFQSRPGRKGVTDLIKPLLRVFTVLWVREVWKREKNNNNKKKPSNMLVSFSKR
ncbi:hypothetical protein F8388_000685 [Cannabis sativa]|uniref:Uncharacterized protein n=1 Tax=Cannabis sativa TaxID=3483 RepID=A0A7J6E3D9_CANSA|nr:hypothetical protein F8388_000685 [Cannabis sativa]